MQYMVRHSGMFCETDYSAAEFARELRLPM
jgi:hypothetical protein